ncbi:MAG: M42 family peptidase [Clostridia bacterium]|nr:M42 family peptidase [Clostridia bacterium]
MDNFYDLLKELCDIPAPSSLEENVRAFLIPYLKDHVDSMKLDRMGNLICEKRGKKKPKAKILLCAHMDEVGFIVTDITGDGYLKYGTLGGIEASILPAKRLYFPELDIYGVICAKPIHLYRDEEELYAPTKHSALYIDIGARTKEEAEKLVKIGDVAVFSREALPYYDAGEIIRSSALDDRLGCAMLCELLTKGTPEYDITVVFHVKEESGLRGAKVGAYVNDYSYAIILEGTTASDLPEAVGMNAVCYQKKGGVLSLFDGATLYDTTLARGAIDALKSAGIAVQTKLRLAGGNDAAALQRSAGAKKVLALSAPCRYIHSPVSTVAKHDLDAMRASLDTLISYCAAQGEKGTL